MLPRFGIQVEVAMGRIVPYCATAPVSSWCEAGFHVVQDRRNEQKCM